MPWSKLKNIMLLLLLLVNGGLLALDLGRSLHSSYLQRQARAQALDFLRERGIAVSEDAVPSATHLTVQRIARDTQQEEQLSEALLGQGVQRQARGGGVFLYENERGTVQFHSGGEFSAQLQPGAVPAQAEEESARELLERLGFRGELVDSDRTENVSSYTFRQLWNGMPLINCRLTLNYQDGCLISLSGARRLPGTPSPDRSVSLLSIPTVLMRFYTELTFSLGDACREIRSIQEGYFLSASLNGPAILTPVWSITTDTGACYQLNAADGSLTRTQ